MFVANSGGVGFKEVVARDVAAYHLRARDGDHPDIVIYPFGIVDQTNNRQPVFEHVLPGLCGPLFAHAWVSTALEFSDSGEHGWLQQPIEPLFNITVEGKVITRFNQ
jgi:hypothetical protein